AFSEDTLVLELCRDFQKALSRTEGTAFFFDRLCVGLRCGVGLSEKRFTLPGCPPKSEIAAPATRPRPETLQEKSDCGEGGLK
ncbi:MAG TPA: hypothetical protein PL182_03430, partial [Pseudobdellovibrionaceae bacterium]|nr:hypothetical protein [Pseudobdellovibrionaceae bacterium]